MTKLCVCVCIMNAIWDSQILKANRWMIICCVKIMMSVHLKEMNKYCRKMKLFTLKTKFFLYTIFDVEKSSQDRQLHANFPHYTLCDWMWLAWKWNFLFFFAMFINKHFANVQLLDVTRSHSAAVWNIN